MSKVHDSKGEEMPKMKTLVESFPDRQNTVLIQADIDIELHARIKNKINQVKKTKKITLKSLIEASLKRWLDEP